MDDDKLTPKQREWLEASAKIGNREMTDEEKKNLEDIFAQMSLTEQADLAEYLQEKFGSNIDFAPLRERENREWTKPSEKLKKALGAPQKMTPPKLGGKSKD